MKKILLQGNAEKLLRDEAVMRASFLCRDTKENHSLDNFSPFRTTKTITK